MFIRSANSTKFYNLNLSTGVVISNKENAFVIMVGFINDTAYSIDRYETQREATAAIKGIYNAMAAGRSVYTLPKQRKSKGAKGYDKEKS